MELKGAAQLMCDMSMGALGVNNPDHNFIGLITERDLMWAVAQGKDPFETRVKDVVNDFPIVVDAPISADDAARRMMSGHVRHLIVGDGSHTASTCEMRRMFGPAGSANLSEVPKYRSSRRAVSAEIARLPCTISLIRRGGTVMSLASRY